jgi:hypothetical protein
MKQNVTPYDILDERIKSMSKALELQAKEYERRLDVLNHENERISEILKQSIPREVFDRFCESVLVRIGATEAAQIKAEGRHQLTQYVPWIIAAAAIVFDYFKK